MKNVMVRAWEIAKGAVNKFGGSAREYFAQALSMAWAEGRKPKTAKEIYKEKQAAVKAMSQSEWNEIINSKIELVQSGMRKYLIEHGCGLDWVKREMTQLIEEGIYDMRKERIVSVEEAAWCVISKRFA